MRVTNLWLKGSGALCVPLRNPTIECGGFRFIDNVENVIRDRCEKCLTFLICTVDQHGKPLDIWIRGAEVNAVSFYDDSACNPSPAERVATALEKTVAQQGSGDEWKNT